MKIFMHWDMEGVSGIFTREHLWYWEPGVRPHIAAEGRQLMTADVNSAIEAALDAGVDEVIVCDTHHGGGNLDLPKVLVDPRVTILPNSVGYEGEERRWMPGMDESVDGMMVMGTMQRRVLWVISCPIRRCWSGRISGLTGKAWARWV